MYKYDTHIHTVQGSKCAISTGAFQAEAYKEAGYDGIMITDHFFRGNSCISNELDWKDKVEAYSKGYEDAKQKGDEIGLKVFFGWEETFDGQDFLIYGLDKEWLLNHPEMAHCSIEEQFEIVSEHNGMVIQAHPFRDRPYIPKIRLFPKHVHGVEVYNACNKPDENLKALKYAKDYNLPYTAGSDNHNPDQPKSGIITSREIKTIQDYIDIVMQREVFEIIQ